MDSKQIFKYLKSIVPEAVCSRSHALTTSSFLIAQYERYGIQYDLNYLIEPLEGMCVRPYRAQVGEVMILPFIFEDDVYISRKERKPMSYYLGESFSAPRIFNFHPQHLFLNTSSPDLYEESKPYYKEYNRLLGFRNANAPGIRDFFLELVALAKEQGYVFRTISEGVWHIETCEEGRRGKLM